MYRRFILLISLLQVIINLDKIYSLKIVDHSIPLFISPNLKRNTFADPALNDLIKTNPLSNNTTEIQTYRERRDAPAFTSLNISIASLEDELFYKSELDGPWRVEILSAPQTIFFLAQLNIVASKREFLLLENSSNYKYIKHPKSFRATVLQISNEVWEAFNKAHHNMNAIQISAQQIPYYIKEALYILHKGSSYGIKELLPSVLKNIEFKSQRAMKLAVEAHSKFAYVMLVIGEVVEAFGESQGRADMKLRDAGIELNITRIMLDESLKMKELVRKEFEDVRSKVKDAENRYLHALSKIPTGLKAIFQEFTRDILKGITEVFTEGLKFYLFGPTSSINSLNDRQNSNEQNANRATSFSEQMGNDGTPLKTLTFAKIFANKISELLPTVDQVFTKDAKLSSNSIDHFEVFKKGFEVILSTMHQLNPNDRTKVLVEEGIQLTGEAIDLIKRGTALFNSKKENQSNQESTDATEINEEVQPSTVESTEEIKENFHNLADRTKPYSVADTLETGESTMNAFSNDHSPTGNAKYLAAIALERLRDCERRYDQRFEEFKKAQELCGQFMIKIAQIDYAKINYEEIISLLCDTLKILGDLREQWVKLIQFFGHIQVLAQNELDMVQAFVQKGKKSFKKPSLMQTDSYLVKELLRKQTIGIHKSTYLIFIMTRTYVDVSRKYVVAQAAGLSKFLAAATDEERNRMKNELYQAAQTTQNEVLAFVDERKNQYHNIINIRLDELNKFLASLGGITNEDQALLDNGKRIEGLD